MKTKPIFWYRWKVSEADFNALLVELETEFALGRADAGLVGLVGELTPQATAPPSMALVLAAGMLVDRAGCRGEDAAPVTLPFTVDHAGDPIDLPGSGKQKWLLVQGRKQTTTSVEVLDGYDHLLDSRAADVRLIEIVQGEEGVGPTKPEPAGDGVILFDVLLSHATTAITLDMVDLSRQETVPLAADAPVSLSSAVGDGVISGEVAGGVQEVPFSPILESTFGQTLVRRASDGGWVVRDSRVALGYLWELFTTGESQLNKDAVLTVEFYGSGLALVAAGPLAASPASFWYSVDEGAPVEVVVPLIGMGSAYRFLRLPFATGLTLGRHTVTLSVLAVIGYDQTIPYGIEIVGPSATAAVEAGEVLVNGRAATFDAVSLTPAATTKGRRDLVVYNPATRTAELVTGTEAVKVVLPPDHADEELVREHDAHAFRYIADIRGGDRFDPAVQGWSLKDVGADPATQWIEDADDNLLTEYTSAFFAFAFEGTGIDVSLLCGADKGIVKAFVRGGDMTSTNETGDLLIDCYQAVPSYHLGLHLTKTFSIAKGLPWGQHVLYIGPNGTKNGSSSSVRIGLAATRTFRVWRPKTPATPAGRVFLAALSVHGSAGENQPNWRRYGSEAGGFTFVGTWAMHDTGAGPWADPYLCTTYAPTSSELNAKIRFKFWGTGICTVFGMESVGAGTITVDGEPMANNNVLTGLDDGLHEVEVTCIGDLEVSLSHLLVERNVDVDPTYPSGLIISEKQAKRFPLG